MDPITALLIAIPVLVLLAGALVLAAARRRDAGDAIGLLARETRRRDRGPVTPTAAEPAAEPATAAEFERAAIERRAPSGEELVAAGAKAPAPWVPPDPEVLDVTRRQFMNRGIITFFGLGLTGFGAASLAFLWPPPGVGFGALINIGTVSDVKARIAAGSGFAAFPEGRMWVTEYPSEALAAARVVYPPPVLAGMEAGFVALWHKCPHLGCRVPECVPSQWFECPCHGTKYNQAGERRSGPGPRGMDHFPLTVTNGRVAVDTSVVISGAPIGTNTTGQEPAGPHCVGIIVP